MPVGDGPSLGAPAPPSVTSIESVTPLASLEPLKSLSLLAQSMGTARDLPTVYRALRDFVLSETPSHTLFVSRYVPEDETRVCVYAYGDGGEEDVSVFPSMPASSASPHARAVATGSPVVCDDLQAAITDQPQHDVGFDADPRLPRSSLAVPMAVLGRIVGGFEVQSPLSAAYRPEHVTTFTMAATLAAVAVENVRLHEEAEREIAERVRLTQRLRLLLDLTTGIGSSFHIDTPLDGALRMLVDTLPGADTAAIFVHDPETGELTPRAFVGLGESFGLVRLRAGEGISGTAFRDGRTVRTEGATASVLRNTVREGNLGHLTGATGGRQVSHSLSVPLRTRTGETVGSLTVSSGRMEFAPDDERLLEGLAAQVAGALDNARLYERVRCQAEDLTAALDHLKQAQVMVVQQERLRALGQLTSGIAHDLNNMLAPVVGFSELLQGSGTALSPGEREWLALIHTGARDAAEVVRRLREFYRPRDERAALAPVDLAAVARDTAALTRPKWKDDAQAAGHTITLGVEVDTARPAPLVSGSAAELREAVTNLIVNAVDALSLAESGNIVIRVRVEGDRGVLEVLDSGEGMPEDVRQRCLEPFFSTKGERGTGLGLAMVHGTVQRHGGTLEIDSVPGRGATIRLRLPFWEGVAPASDPDRAEIIVPLQVLVVDDEPAVLAVVTALLESDGHRVTGAPDGRQGIDMLAAQVFDLVVTDRAMPGGVTGEHVAAAAKARDPRLPVLLLTGYGDMMLAAGERPSGVDAIIAKPVTRSTLRAAIADVVARPAAPAPVLSMGNGRSDARSA